MEFRALGVDLISHQENVDTTTPQGGLVFGLVASLDLRKAGRSVTAIRRELTIGHGTAWNGVRALERPNR